MQQALRPYATAGIALVGASMIAVTPVAAPPIDLQMRPVKLVDAWTDLFTDTAANVQNILSGADSSAISQVFTTFLTNPFGVIGALTNLTPTITTDITSLPGTISVELPPGLELGIAQFGAWGATLTAINDVLPQVESNPANLFEAVATVLNGYFNGEDNISLLDGTINIAGFNGILAPLQSVSIDFNLTNLINALGLGNLGLSQLDLSSLLSQLGLGDVTLGGLFTDLGLSSKGLGDLLGNPTLGTVLSDLGLGKLDVGSLSLTTLLTDLFPNGIDVGGVNLGTLLTDLGLGGEGVGTLLQNVPGIAALVDPLFTADPALLTALNTFDLSDLVDGLTLGNGGALDLNTLVTDLFSALGVPVPSTGDLTLGSLLGDLNIDNLSVGSLLNTVNLGDLLTDLGISNLPLNLSDLGDISGLTLSGLLGDLGLGDIANITVDPFGGMITELVDVVPQQILAALGM
jgi:hypothetical protein